MSVVPVLMPVLVPMLVTVLVFVCRRAGRLPDGMIVVLVGLVAGPERAGCADTERRDDDDRSQAHSSTLTSRNMPASMW